jgi:hypothetical protein
VRLYLKEWPDDTVTLLTDSGRIVVIGLSTDLRMNATFSA